MSAAEQQTDAFQKSWPRLSPMEFVEANSVFTSRRVIVEYNRSSWFQALEKRFNELTSLPIGWNGYNGRPVSFTCAKFAASLLERLCRGEVPAPSLVPGSDGTLQIEWHINQYDIEIDVLGANNVVATRYNHVTRQEDVIELQSDFMPISGWIDDLTNEQNAAM